MRKLIVAALLLTATGAQADVIECVFTEPFVNSTYDMASSTLTYTDVEGKTQVTEYVNMIIKGPGVFELREEHGALLQTLNLTFKGSNGMSDHVYPFEVKDEGMGGMANGGYGGCESEELKATEGQP